MQDRRAGESFEDHVIVLGHVPLKESDRLVQLLTLDHGKVSAVARGAAKSVKRFGAALDPMTYGKAQLQLGRGVQSSNGQLWILTSVEAKSSFLHFRKEYPGIEAGFFSLKLIDDLVPEGMHDPKLFKALGRYLRDSEGLKFSRCAGWARVAMWVWFTQHLGYGQLDEALQGRWDQSVYQALQTAFDKGLKQPEPEFANVFKVLNLLSEQSEFRDLSQSEEALIYKKWVEVSGIHWDHFEKWLASKKS